MPPQPVLDANGLQRYDPDGKPMFYPTIYQLRDKHGNPVFGEDKKPVFQSEGNLGYDERGKAIKVAKVKFSPPPKKTVIIEHGALMVDGIVGKVRLDYTIDDLHYLYIYVPEIGVTVISDQPFPGAKIQPNAFRETMLSVHVDKRLLQISSDQSLLGHKTRPAFVAVDRTFTLPEKFPVFGYGDTALDPYVWPGSQHDTSYISKDAPPVLRGLKPKSSETVVQETTDADDAKPNSSGPSAR